MSKIKGAIVVDTGRCKGCALCVVACPQHVIALAEKKVNVHGYRYVEAAVPDAFGVVTEENSIIYDNKAGKTVYDKGKKGYNLKRGQAYLQKLYDDISKK